MGFFGFDSQKTNSTSTSTTASNSNNRSTNVSNVVDGAGTTISEGLDPKILALIALIALAWFILKRQGKL